MANVSPHLFLACKKKKKKKDSISEFMEAVLKEIGLTDLGIYLETLSNTSFAFQSSSIIHLSL